MGADICGRCIKAWDAREEKKRKAKNKRTREYYKKTRDRQIAYSESYRSNGRKSIIKKKRQYYRDNAELIKKKRREYYAENRERLLTAQQAKRQARRTEVTSSPMDSDTRPGHADPSQNPVTPT